MNETEWQNSTNPSDLVFFLRGKAIPRQTRLFACACARQVWQQLLNPASRAAVEVAERWADGLASWHELTAARRAAVAVVAATGDGAAEAAQYATRVIPWEAAVNACRHSQGDTRAQQCRLLRCVVGNPFRPLPARTFQGHVVALARTICAAFPDVAAVADEYLVLADALEELGEDLAADHCRQPEHARGCHVLDRIEPPQRPKRRRRTTSS
jgi:hypothetical protein